MSSRDSIAFALSATAGFAVCIAITLATGKKEAWDSGLYFTIGIPLMCVIAFGLGWKFPEKAWRWALGIALGQSVAMLLGGGSLSLWPLAIVAMTILSLPQCVAALLGSRLSRTSS
jgi:hypothetical protein